MAEINYFEIIQNKLDALVEKIVQKENSDEDFRITYAQILEKINTKMDIFSNDNTYERINMIGIELGKLIKERQDVVDAKFNAVKGEFDNLNDILTNSLKTPELLAAFNKIQNQIHYFSEEQENQKFAFNSMVSKLEKNDLLEETNDNLRANFAIVKEQNTIINEAVNKQIDLLNKYNETIEENNKKALDDLNTIIFSLKEFSESVNDDASQIKTFVEDKVNSIITKIHETDSLVELLNNNLTTLIQVVGDLFDDEIFQEVKNDVADILVKTSFMSEELKKIATKEELLTNSDKNKEEIKAHSTSLISDLETKLLSKLDFSAIEDIKNYTEKMFFQGTEVLKEEIWTIKDTVADLNNAGLKKDDFDSKFLEISSTIESLKNDISDIILNEQNEKISNALNLLQSKFVTQLVQIADNISFAEEAEDINENVFSCSEEIKEKISSDIADIKQEFALLKEVSNSGNIGIIDLLTKIESVIQTDITNDLKTLISGFKLLTTGLKDDKDYVYTLPDIESDLSKIRLDLSNIQKTLVAAEDLTDEDSNDITSKINNIKIAVEKLQDNPIYSEIAEIKGLFDGLNEDIASISKRTNKLIIASDEVNKALKSNIIAFSSLINGFEKQSREFYNSAFINELNNKVENLSVMTSSVLQSEQVLNEAFMYMGEWIDSASDSFDEIKADVSKMKKNLLSDESGAAEKLEHTVKSLSQKVELQEAKIDSLDEKLNKIMAQQQETKEIKSLIEYVASQVSVTNEKIIENDMLAQKISNMEKQLKKIEKNVAAITDYIDEEDEEEFFNDDEDAVN